MDDRPELNARLDDLFRRDYSRMGGRAEGRVPDGATDNGGERGGRDARRVRRDAPRPGRRAPGRHERDGAQDEVGRDVQAQTAVRPPSTTTSEPVMNEDSSEARKTTRAAISSGRAMRPIGSCSEARWR
jgi:hypothetical protein